MVKIILRVGMKSIKMVGGWKLIDEPTKNVGLEMREYLE
jgi:hypothetical protein